MQVSRFFCSFHFNLSRKTFPVSSPRVTNSSYCWNNDEANQAICSPIGPKSLESSTLILLEELELPYEIDYIPITALKTEPFINVNPNGKVPAIEDPNTNIALWEV